MFGKLSHRSTKCANVECLENDITQRENVKLFAYPFCQFGVSRYSNITTFSKSLNFYKISIFLRLYYFNFSIDNMNFNIMTSSRGSVSNIKSAS